MVSPPGRLSPSIDGLSLLSLSAPQAGSNFGGRKPRARASTCAASPSSPPRGARRRGRGAASCVTPPEPAVDAGRSKGRGRGCPSHSDLDARPTPCCTRTSSTSRGREARPTPGGASCAADLASERTPRVVSHYKTRTSASAATRASGSTSRRSSTSSGARAARSFSMPTFSEKNF